MHASIDVSAYPHLRYDIEEEFIKDFEALFQSELTDEDFNSNEFKAYFSKACLVLNGVSKTAEGKLPVAVGVVIKIMHNCDLLFGMANMFADGRKPQMMDALHASLVDYLDKLDQSSN